MKPTWKIVLLLLAIVAVSTLLGGYGGYEFARWRARARSNPDGWNVSAMRTLDSKLTLTPPQHDRVQAIIDGGVDELRGIRIDTIARSNRVIERLIGEITAELTSAQKEEFAKLKAERLRANLDMLKVEPRKK